MSPLKFANGGRFVKKVDSGRELSRSDLGGVPDPLAGEASSCGDGVSGDGVSNREGVCDAANEPDSGLPCWPEP